MNIVPIKSPFPWFGGKSKVSSLVWKRLGNVPNFVEPFFGSGAVLLARPHEPKIETINDKDQFVANFWRAVKADPDGVAEAADWPVNETDLHARHYWLITEGRERIKHIDGDPFVFDVQVAGWWLWGTCCWIGSGFCSGNGPWQGGAGGLAISGDGGINRQLPHLGDAGQGINRKLPFLNRPGQGINSNRADVDDLQGYMRQIASRLENVRVCAGDWSRVCGPSVTEKNGLTGIFLDPPYADTAGRQSDLYSTDSRSVAHDVRKWAIANGGNSLLRICLAGYDGEHVMPGDWSEVAWKTQGGFGGQGNGAGRDNATRERLWFSPNCLKPERGQASMFDILDQILEAAE